MKSGDKGMVQKKHVVVIGAGIVGVSTAIWLQRAGLQVTLIDREGPAAGTSYGNAGLLAAAAIVPVTVPGLLKKAPGMLFNPNQPLFLRWSYMPRLLPFLMRYLSYANKPDMERIATNLNGLLHDTVDQHLALAKGTKAESFIKTGDYIFGYKDRASFEYNSMEWGVRKRNGLEFEEMDEVRFAEYDPAMAGRFGFGARCPNHGYILDPSEYVKALATHIETGGGTFLKAEVSDIMNDGELASSVVTTQGNVPCDHVVMATGIWSGPLAKKLGIKIPLEAERGYHIEFVNPSITPKSPIMVSSGKFVITPMKGRLRCAGIVEFGGLNDKRSKAPIELLKRQVLELIPELEYDRIDEWMGHRPSTPDSLPVIGSLGKVKNIWAGFGHQHIGLTAGPKTGRWLAQLISGQSPNIDLKPYASDRF